MKQQIQKIAFFLCLAFTSLHADQIPQETIVLKLPQEEMTRKWKEISNLVLKDQCQVELIPSSQSSTDWSELVSIMYFSPKFFSPLDKIIETVRDQTFKNYPGKKVTWNVLEKKETEVTFEWILHSQYKDIPPQHEVARMILTSQGIHRIGITRRNGEMSKEEREKWIQLVKNQVSVEPIEVAAKMNNSMSLLSNLYLKTMVALLPSIE